MVFADIESAKTIVRRTASIQALPEYLPIPPRRIAAEYFKLEPRFKLKIVRRTQKFKDSMSLNFCQTLEFLPNLFIRKCKFTSSSLFPLY